MKASGDARCARSDGQWCMLCNKGFFFDSNYKVGCMGVVQMFGIIWLRPQPVQLVADACRQWRQPPARERCCGAPCRLLAEWTPPATLLETVFFFCVSHEYTADICSVWEQDHL